MADEEKRGAAVYVGWTTFKNAIDQLAQGLPNRIDRTCFPGQAGGVQSQLLAGLKFLGLIDEDGKPTRSLQSLVAADEAGRKEQFKKILHERYADLFALDLTKTTPGELSETMAAKYNVSGDTRTKAIRFFITAASWVNIPMSKLLLKASPNTANGGGSAAPRRRRPAVRSRAASGAEENNGDDEEEVEPPSSGTSRTVNLQSGGTLTISVSLDVLRLSSSDRQFVFGLIDKLEEYEQKTVAAGAA